MVTFSFPLTGNLPRLTPDTPLLLGAEPDRAYRPLHGAIGSRPRLDAAAYAGRPDPFDSTVESTALLHVRGAEMLQPVICPGSQRFAVAPHPLSLTSSVSAGLVNAETGAGPDCPLACGGLSVDHWVSVPALLAPGVSGPVRPQRVDAISQTALPPVRVGGPSLRVTGISRASATTASVGRDADNPQPSGFVSWRYVQDPRRHGISMQRGVADDRGIGERPRACLR